ncbi:UNVERIFIED_CONTAM: Nuclear/nucleolar GTPase 2 [Sesamum angustifolium]|uniref:Nuclear/nucleolar GTPase 2 n=1 Tax=Sesamum angustifolium TaxID=2727405 RepID=A0AAW2PD17_9LAMI
MAKKKERSVNVSGKPKHSLDVNRDGGKTKSNNGRSAATVRRLKMYNTRPTRDSKGKILKHDLQSKELPSTRIMPDRRWFGNTRVVNQKELEFFREELQNRLSSNYNVLLKERKIPMSLLNDNQKQARVHLLDTEPFSDAFGPKTKRKRPKLIASDYESLLKRVDDSQDAFEEKHGASTSAEGGEDGFRDLVRHTMFEKGQSKRIWGELYKVVDSSDVVVQVLDARDPQGTRCYHLERHLKEHCKHKHMILLLNKGSLLSVLRQFSRLKSDKQAISVGFVGYPNVGNHPSSILCVQRMIDISQIKISPDNIDTLHINPEHSGPNLFTVPQVSKVKLKLLIFREDDNDFLVQLCKSTGKLLKGGEPDLMTAAKVILHDWQRGKIPFFVPPPKQEADVNEPEEEKDKGVDDDKNSAARKAIEDVISSQQIDDVPIQEDLFSEQELRAMAQDTGMFTVPQTIGSVLCCKCGILMQPNAANMCAKCLRSEVDITEGLKKHVIIIHCPECDTYLQPPRTWIKAQLESKELLTFCVKRLKNLNKVRLVHAEFIWTEPHSKRIKVKLRVQKEVLNGAILEQAYTVEYVVQDQMCESCSRVQANPDQWVAAVQLRQHVSHRRTFFYLEQLILKHDAAKYAIRIRQMDQGVDFFFSNRSHGVKFVEFLGKVTPIRSRNDKQLVSHDPKSNNYNYNTFSVEISPICREDLICLPPKLAVSLGNFGPLVICNKVTNSIALLDPFTLRQSFLDAEQYWRSSFKALLSSRQLVEYIVLDVEPVSSEVNVGGLKYVLADAQVARVSDFGKNDTIFNVRTHLGHILNPGDYALVMTCMVPTITISNWTSIKVLCSQM